MPHPVSYVDWPHTKEWNGGLAEEHVRRENAIHTQTRGVCVCVYVSQSKRESHPVPQEGGWLCVCVYGKRENHPVPQGGGVSFLPGPHAQLENHKTAGVGGGDAAGSRAQNRSGGEGDAAQGGGGGGENTP